MHEPAATVIYTFSLHDGHPPLQALAVGQTLTDTFNYTMSDGSLTDEAGMTITIKGGNDAPVGIDDGGNATEKGATANGTTGSNATVHALTNDTDVEPASGPFAVTATRWGGPEGAG